MTRLEAAFATAAALLAAAGTASASHRLWWETTVFLGVAVFSLEGAARERRARRDRRRRARVEAQRAELAARDDALAPAPCCQFWLSSEGAVHGHDCTRPPAARTTLSEAEQRILNELADDTQDSA
ncbi:hypothetical protein [Streptomyces sp. WAC00263]|uniref:hypothetical protein n=1 Tax=Streptomyces sp. WAC00263 TaxID=1917422 RepID=UPI0015EEFB5D|nr:hypothetical protein [Streptomyces sp. WAC00263]KAF5998693.1 hypothetical protein BOG92_049745 [Streptomyces sp. WAC00263]